MQLEEKHRLTSVLCKCGFGSKFNILLLLNFGNKFNICAGNPHLHKAEKR